MISSECLQIVKRAGPQGELIEHSNGKNQNRTRWTKNGAWQGQDVERNRLEKLLEIGLEETFPASDAVAVIEPAPEKHED
jgi:hypothetical protein